jgi:hypothetical protein
MSEDITQVAFHELAPANALKKLGVTKENGLTNEEA